MSLKAGKITSKRTRRQSGLSLVELMIAVTLGMILTAGVIQIFVSSEAAYDTTRGLSHLQENGRFALTFMTRDARLSGYSLCTQAVRHNIHNLTNNTYLSTTRYQNFVDIAAPVHGWEAQNTGPGDTPLALGKFPTPSTAMSNWSDDGGNALDSYFSGRVLPGSDVVVFKRTMTAFGDDGALPEPKNTGNVAASTTTINLNEDSGIANKAYVLLNDCKGADVFVNNSAPDQTNVDRGGSNNNTALTLSHDYGAGQMRLATVRTTAYFVGQGTSGEPALFRWQLQGNTFDELLEGVESLQVLYGEDTNGSVPPSVDTYVTADNVTDWGNVLSVKIALLMRNVEDTGGQPDTRVYKLGAAGDPTSNTNLVRLDPADMRRLRDVYKSTITLRNSMARFQ